MKKTIRVFVDSDVFISACISQNGAAFFLMKSPGITRSISNYSQEEIKIVAKRLKIKPKTVRETTFLCTIITLPQKLHAIKTTYTQYVRDPLDAHIVAGAVDAKSSFLLTYNIKHYDKEKIKRDFGIIVCPPAFFLQYLRSLE